MYLLHRQPPQHVGTPALIGTPVLIAFAPHTHPSCAAVCPQNPLPHPLAGISRVQLSLLHHCSERQIDGDEDCPSDYPSATAREVHPHQTQELLPWYRGERRARPEGAQQVHGNQRRCRRSTEVYTQVW